ncbi:MAG: hypothetical protein EP318_17420 [Rhodobacteraceae bacterium]|nr:MAG: hypothetical protein EP318_17420 [Paracoccaceae bacterium]
MRVLVLILLAFLPGALVAETRAALILAAERYEALRPLANPVNDARAVEARLLDLGFEVYIETNRDLRRMRRALEDFLYDAEGADVALIYFAGHGMEVAGQNLLLPVDAPAGSVEDLTRGALPLDEVAETLQQVAPVGLLIVDACRSDPFGTEGRGAMALGARPEIKPGLARMGRADRLLYAFSAAPGQAALDGEGENSPFTEALTRHLATPGLEIRQVLTLVQQDVYDRTRGRQLPYVESGLPSLVFAGGQSALPEREVLLLSMAGLQPAHRGLIERIAAEHDMPLAPLFGAFLSADLAARTLEEQTSELTSAAQAFDALRRDMATLSSDDPRVNALRAEADAQLALGAFTTARARLTEAAGIDRASRDTLKENYLSRTLSEAETHFINGQAAEADLRRALAVEDYHKAARLFAEARALSGAVPEKLLYVHERLGNVLVVEGNLSAARAAYSEGFAAAEAYLAAAPEDRARQRILWVAQDKLGNVARTMGDLGTAQKAYAAGLQMIETMAEADPEDIQAQSDLATNLERIGDMAQDTGDLATARAAYLRSLEISERLVALRPDDTLWRRNLALAYRRQADIAVALGDLSAARADYDRARVIVAALAEGAPEVLEWQRDISILDTKLGDLARKQGDLTDAQASYAAALDIADDLAVHDPGNTEWQRDLSISYERLGDVQRDVGDLASAQSAYDAALAIRQELTARDPANTQWQRDLSLVHTKRGDIALARGDPAAATRAYRAVLEIAEALAARDPENRTWQRDLEVALNRLGDAAFAANDPEAAREAYEAGQAIALALAARDPENTLWRRDVSVSGNRLGDALWALGDTGAAAQAYRSALYNMALLAARDPNNAEWQRDLTISYDRLGDVALAAGDLDGARAEYSAARDIRRALTARDGANTQWQRDLAISHTKLGALAFASGDTAAAREALGDSLALRRSLAVQDPTNGQWQIDLAVTLFDLSRTGDAPRDRLTEILGILRRLEAEDRLPPVADGWIALVEAELAKLAPQ